MENQVKIVSEMDNIGNGTFLMSPEGAVNMRNVGIATPTIEKLTNQKAFSPEEIDTFDLNNNTPIKTEDPSSLESIDFNMPTFTNIGSIDEKPNTVEEQPAIKEMVMPEMPADIPAKEPDTLDNNLFVTPQGTDLESPLNENVNVSTVEPQTAETEIINPNLDAVSSDVANNPNTPPAVLNNIVQTSDVKLSEDFKNKIRNYFDDLRDKVIQDIEAMEKENVESETINLNNPLDNASLQEKQETSFNMNNLDLSNLQAQATETPEEKPILDTQVSSVSEDGLFNPLAQPGEIPAAQPEMNGSVDNVAEVISSIDESPIQAEPGGKFIQF